ncbi:MULTISPECIES: carbohydrate ABC transporter permease [Paenibacillus]|uniref:Carbohydrate ABC transporter permease n=1 Tax=Paenibacillus odorifer TaxID=189426 RepID=A0A1R0YSC5_9BACL|nr:MULTISPECIES: carbohydrate ABC transporter permease [Paenibacillus]AIQ72503.1 sugar ABC transporter permease [Paenibacillus odorifer]AWV31868.1 carbohydrate ABC transporter permease [Paenibacillus odorifer]ETT54013.1 binding-protein-dependent transport system inner membrane protein [Paenibacillus sp. FSL H8-237]MEC0132375.1 carbohydrate ABC transporter permease [Paenibacillus odorifer]MEC0219868.1 carbohydrate ABC transporter permease [Paenibacillus odorifer]
MSSITKTKKERDFHHLSTPWNITFNLIAGIFAFLCVFPFLFVVIISFTDEVALARDGYKLIPAKWSLGAYRYVFESGDMLLRSYGVTIFVTVIGTIISLLFIAFYAYAISRKSFRYRNFFSFFAFFTMLFNGGLVPTYIIVTQFLSLKDTIWALILPLAVNAFYIMILRTFYSTSVPDAIIESGKIDGAGEFRIFLKLVLPLSLPGLATIALFSTLGYWNDWFNALLYIDNPNLVPLQSMLMRIETSMQFILQNSQNSSLSLEALRSMPQDTSRMAMVVLATGPIIFAYPFFQRYFIQGLTVGAVKE